MDRLAVIVSRFAKNVINSSANYYRAHSGTIKSTASALLIVLLITLVWQFRQHLPQVVIQLKMVGPKVLLLPLIFLLWNYFATMAWKKVLQALVKGQPIEFWRLYLIRIQGQALNLVLPLSGIAGESLRFAKTSIINGMSTSITAVMIDKTIDLIAEILVAVFGLILYFIPSILLHQTIHIVFALFITLTVVVIFWQKIWVFILQQWLLRIGKESFLPLTRNPYIGEASRQAFLHHCGERLLMIGEIFIIAAMIDINLGIRDILIITAVASFGSVLFILVPGRFGSFEFSMAFAFSLLSLPPAAGVTIALVRRARQIIVSMIGIYLIVKPLAGETVFKKRNNVPTGV